MRPRWYWHDPRCKGVIFKDPIRLMLRVVVLSGLFGSVLSAMTQQAFVQQQDQASEQFLAWQKAMFETRQDMARKRLRLFYQNMKVPPLPKSDRSSGATGAENPETDRIRIDVPLPFPTDTQLTVHAGQPSASFQVGVEGKALSFIGASYSAGVTYCASDNAWIVGDAADLKLGLDAGPAELTGTYQYHAARWGQPGPHGPPAGVDLSADLYWIKGALGYNTQQELSISAGYDLVKTPKALSFLAEASVGVQAQVTAPVKVQGLTQSKRRSLSGTLARQVAGVVKLLTAPTPCPHCSAQGQLDCATCSNTRHVQCTQCLGKREFECIRCEGGGFLYCPTCEGTTSVTCRSCDGTGQLRCSTCGGGGQVTVYDSEMRSRQVRKLISAGFNENGEPFEEWGYETEFYTVQVPRQQTCSNCSGTGQGGPCGQCSGTGKATCTRCQGSGTVYCSKCKGTGKIKCSKCRGTGQITCADCRGKPIRCPLCKGNKQLGK